MKRNICFLAVFVLVFASCQFFDVQPLAVRLGEHQLSMPHVQQYCARFLDRADSVHLCNDYLQNWVDRRLIADYALQSIDTVKVNRLVEENKLDIILSLFYKDVLQKELEASILEEEIVAFYDNHPSQFVIEQPIVQVFLISRFKNDFETLKHIQTLFAKLPMSAEEVDAFLMAHQIDGNLHHLSTRFEFLYELKNLFPFLEQAFVDKKIFKNLQFSYPQEDNVYHVFILDYKEKGLLPFYLAKNKIKLHILTQKKQDYLTQLITQLKNAAVASGSLKYK